MNAVVSESRSGVKAQEHFIAEAVATSLWRLAIMPPGGLKDFQVKMGVEAVRSNIPERLWLLVLLFTLKLAVETKAYLPWVGHMYHILAGLDRYDVLPINDVTLGCMESDYPRLVKLINEAIPKLSK